ncbi:MAG TPA: hydroxymethylbilane synthase, partial [Hyphomicrobium sp.]|nr:hydroxymethylbilane synthase [Hyphomicrobium sp.]
RPDLKVVDFRGNVQTRLRKLADGVADATFLACAGLNRLGLAQHITAAMDTDVMLPAVAQGAIGIEIRADDENTANLLAPLNHAPTAICVTAERAYLIQLEGSCRTPIAGHAELLADGALRFRGEILSADGKRVSSVEHLGASTAAAAIGQQAATDVLGQAGPDFFATA